MVICKHCGDSFRFWYCNECNAGVYDACEECHMELVHGIINPTGVHIVGHGAPPNTDGIDGDVDAFKRSDS